MNDKVCIKWGNLIIDVIGLSENIRNPRIVLYFLTFILGVSSLGIWLPILEGNFDYFQFITSSIVYGLSIASLSMIKLISQKETNTNSFVNSDLMMFLLCLFIITILLSFIAYASKSYLPVIPMIIFSLMLSWTSSSYDTDIAGSDTDPNDAVPEHGELDYSEKSDGYEVN